METGESERHALKRGSDPLARSAELLSGRGESLGGLGFLGSNHGGNAWTEDPGLLSGDLSKGPPEPLGMIECDRRDGTGDLRGGVGGVESAPESGLQDDHLATGALKEIEGHRGDEFEEGRLIPLSPTRGCFSHSLDGTLDVGRGGIHPVDPDPLGQIDQMGRGVETDAQPHRPKNRLGEGGDGPLAVGARDVEASEIGLRVAKRGQKTLHPLQSGNNAASLGGLKPL